MPHPIESRREFGASGSRGKTELVGEEGGCGASFSDLAIATARDALITGSGEQATRSAPWACKGRRRVHRSQVSDGVTWWRRRGGAGPGTPCDRGGSSICRTQVWVAAGGCERKVLPFYRDRDHSDEAVSESRERLTGAYGRKRWEEWSRGRPRGGEGIPVTKRAKERHRAGGGETETETDRRRVEIDRTRSMDQLGELIN